MVERRGREKEEVGERSFDRPFDKGSSLDPPAGRFHCFASFLVRSQGRWFFEGFKPTFGTCVMEKHVRINIPRRTRSIPLVIFSLLVVTHMMTKRSIKPHQPESIRHHLSLCFCCPLFSLNCRGSNPIHAFFPTPHVRLMKQ